MTTTHLTRRGFLIAGATATAVAWLTGRQPAAVAAVPQAAADAPAERPHRTLLGVL